MDSRPSPRQSRRTLTALALTLAMLGGMTTRTSASPQNRPQFRSDVDVMQMQVSVVDGQGNFVHGLTPADFRLRVNGKDRQITTVYEVNLAGETVAGAGAVADAGFDTSAVPPAGWRQWLLFFDVGFNSPRGIRAAQEAAVTFMEEQVQPRDLVGVAAYTATAGVRLVAPLTRDRRQVMAALDGLGLKSAPGRVDAAGFISQLALESAALADDSGDPAGAGGPGIDGSAEADALVREALQTVNSLEFDQYSSAVAQYTGQLGTLAELLQTIRGRKQVVFFSKGFDDGVLSGQSLDDFAATTDAMQQDQGLAIAQAGTESRFGSADVRSELDDSIDAMRAADAVIHIFDASGVGGERQSGFSRGASPTGNFASGTSSGGNSGSFASRGSTRGALTALAEGTNGTMTWDTNDLTGAMAELERSTRSFYVMAFARDKGDKKVLDIKVETKRPGAKIASAPTRLAPPADYKDMDGRRRSVQLAEFITKGIIESNMSVDVAATPFRGDDNVSRIGVVVEIPWEQLEEFADETGGTISLDLFSYVLDSNGTIIDASNQRVGLDFKAMSGSPAAGLPYRFYDLLWGRAGNEEVRVLVRESEIGRLSAVSTRAKIPDFSTGMLSVSGPISIDHLHPGLIARGRLNPLKADSEGPTAYPYVIGQNELTPTARATGAAGTVQQLYVVAYNLARHPFTGQTQSQVALSLRAPDGTVTELSDSSILGRFFDAQAGATQFLLNTTIPAGISSGFYNLNVAVIDQISGVTVDSAVELWVSTDG